MAFVNPPPSQQLPRQFFEDAEVRKYMEALQFNVFQLWKRTGGGTDLIETVITQETTNTSTSSGNTGKIARLTQRVAELESNDRSGEFKQSIARLNQRINELVDAITEELENFHRPNREIEQASIELMGQMIKEIRLLSERAAEAWDSSLTIEDIDDGE